MALARSARFWIAVFALAAALALLAPSVVPLSGSMDAFAQDLANGTFKPFGQLGVGPAGTGYLNSFASTLGGFTGQSPGNYLPGGGDVPNDWTLDRDGHGGTVTIDSVFNPDLGAMKRLKAYDTVLADGSTLSVTDARLQPLSDDPTLRYDRAIEGSYAVQFHAGQPVAIFSPHPKARINNFATDPKLPGSVQFYRDAADTLYAVAHVDQLATLNVTFVVSSDYYSLPPIAGVRTSDYAYSARVPKPALPAQLRTDAQSVLARAGVKDATDVGEVLDKLSVYFRSFTEGDIPPPTEVESLYLALALGGHGCCRHRAFAFMVTAQAVGIPTRVVVNEAHAFVEVELPDGHWHQINLGGCGSYVVNNPNHYASLFDQASDPRTEANPDEGTPVTKAATTTEILDAPARIVKGDAFLVNGSVVDASKRGVPGARVDLYLNATKTTAGRLTGTGSTGADGRFSILAKVPADAPAQGYQLVAHGTDGHATTTRYDESWSDPTVQVFAPTKLTLTGGTGAAGFPLNVSGKLTDSQGAAVANASVEWSTDAATWTPAATDARGLFTVAVTEASVGDYVLHFRYQGSANYGPTASNVTVHFGTGAILLPTISPTLTRGKAGIVSGSVVVTGASLAGRSVSGDIVGATAALGTTDADGNFALSFVPPSNLKPGVYALKVNVDSLGLTAESAVRVAAGATLAVDTPTSLRQGDGWTLVATLTGDNGTRISGGIVQVVIDGNATSARQLLTNRTGVARFDFPPGELASGAHGLRVVFLGDADHVDITKLQSMTVTKPFLQTLPWWTVPLVLVAAALLVGIVLLARRAPKLVAAALPQTRFLSVAFPDHPPGVPPVFEPGETARVKVLVRDRKGRARDARVMVASERAHARGEDGALVAVAMPPRVGRTQLRVRARGPARLWTRAVVLDVPVMSFRQAVEETFVDLRARVARLDASATPGDVVRRLAPRLREPAASEALRRAARMFEVADYSEASVDRAFYQAFASAAQEAADAAPI